MHVYKQGRAKVVVSGAIVVSSCIELFCSLIIVCYQMEWVHIYDPGTCMLLTFLIPSIFICSEIYNNTQQS